MKLGIGQALGWVAIAGASLLTIAMLSRFERPPVETVQAGFRGTAMVENYNPRLLAALRQQNVIPASLPPLPAAGPKAGQVYKNVQVLGDLSVGQFTRLMASITTWVAPKQGCAYCHNPANMAEDSRYTKVVARRMIQMVQHVNADWQSHVKGTGVTCYTCHRGQPVPSRIWFNDPGPRHARGLTESSFGMAHPAGAAGDSALPYDPFTPFLQKADAIRVQGTTALPTGNRMGIRDAEWTYALMMYFSDSLGVNCTYCHNTRSFGDWSQSTPQRVVAWHGIRMVRDLNDNYLTKLHDVFPPYRLGPTGDAPKLACATCHQGVYKPLFGVSMLPGFPELAHPLPPAAAK